MPGGGKTALDVAVTSPLQAGELLGAAQEQLAAARSYERRKLNDRDTARKCLEDGIELKPLIVESFGGWGPVAQQVFKTLAYTIAARTCKSMSLVTNELYGGLSIRLMRANARSILSRCSDESAEAPTHVDRARCTLILTNSSCN